MKVRLVKRNNRFLTEAAGQPPQTHLGPRLSKEIETFAIDTIDHPAGPFEFTKLVNRYFNGSLGLEAFEELIPSMVGGITDNVFNVIDMDELDRVDRGSVEQFVDRIVRQTLNTKLNNEKQRFERKLQKKFDVLYRELNKPLKSYRRRKPDALDWADSFEGLDGSEMNSRNMQTDIGGNPLF